jgi:hypothetical protein
VFDKELLKGCNECAYTGIETVKHISLFDDVSVYESRTQEHHNIRLVFSDNGIGVCGVLLRKHNKSKFNDYVVSGVFTDNNVRLKGYAKGLIALAKMYVRNECKAKLCLDNNLTELGEQLFKNGV